MTVPTVMKAIFMRRQSANFCIQDIKTRKEYIFEHQPQNPWVEGELLTISVTGTRQSGKHKTFLQGKVIDSALDLEALNITPLKIHNYGQWDPFEEYGEDAREWCPHHLDKVYYRYEMEAIEYYFDEDPEFDPAIYAMDLFRAGRENQAKRELGAFLCKDWRYLDGHNHLGIMEERRGRYHKMKKHYELSFKIGCLTVNQNLRQPILPWPHLENRPFLRALQGYGLALAHLGQEEKALRIFEWGYQLWPMDNLGLRFVIDDLKQGRDPFEQEDDIIY